MKKRLKKKARQFSECLGKLDAIEEFILDTDKNLDFMKAEAEGEEDAIEKARLLAWIGQSEWSIFQLNKILHPVKIVPRQYESIVDSQFGPDDIPF